MAARLSLFFGFVVLVIVLAGASRPAPIASALNQLGLAIVAVDQKVIALESACVKKGGKK